MDNRPVGVYDSGVGGAAVLRTISHILPNEKYILLADFKNAPYGGKSKEEIFKLADENIKLLIDRGVKAAVVACNTATSAAIAELRQKYEIPIIGMEPAVKPASINGGDKKTLVLATEATLKLMKFQKLVESLGDENIVPVPCPGLSVLIEKELPNSPKIEEYLDDILSAFKKEDISAVVIGCTHYSFIENQIKKAAGTDNVFDGRFGTAKHLKKTLERYGLLAENEPSTEFVITGDGDRYQNMINDFMEYPLSLED